MNFQKNKSGFYSALVWVVAGVALVIYGTLGFLNATIPGVEDLVSFLSNVEAEKIYVAAFISIFIEGLYFVGSFFPGSTLIIVMTILSQLSGMSVFLGTILSIFAGWCLAGALNIFLARTYLLKIAHLKDEGEYQVKDRFLTTWFPAFRANYEVAQVTEGGRPLKVFISSVRVKFLASLAAAAGLLIIPIFIDIKQVSNEEGFASVAVVAAISFTVGFIKLRKYFK